MPLDDDDDEKWVYRPHTAAKHEVLQKYLNPWINKLTSYNERSGDLNKIRVVDCFAGRGSYIRTEDTEPLELENISSGVERPGSPQLILDKFADRSDQFRRAEAVFIEANEHNYDILTQNIESVRGYPERKVSIDCVYGEFQNCVLDVIESTDGNDVPTLFFIDPFGFSSLDYEVITEIGSVPQFEILITFMYRDMNRFLNSEDHKEALNRVFGEESWDGDIEKYSPSNWEPLVEYYTDRLENGGVDHTFEYLITEPDTIKTIYYLVFGTNSQHGLKVMREVMSNCGTGRFGYAPKKDKHDTSQKLLTGPESPNDYLKDRFEDMRISFGRVVEISSEENPYTDWVESDYRISIRELEDRGEVKIDRNESKETGIQAGDMIDFRVDS